MTILDTRYGHLVFVYGVCRAWRSVTSEKHYYTGVSGYKVPWLMMAEKEASDIRSFYSLSTKKFINISLPEVRGRRCWGSPNGWLITIGIDLEEVGERDYAIFVGNNYSFSLSISEYPELKRNSIYFTDDYSEIYEEGGGRNTGIFDNEEETIEFIDLGLDMRSAFSPPLWITPNLC
ncbi:hypothetical protein GIB67_033452 [Kingdonia uniflora]|uniref:KIB1-4 beta-propeller domain-containing protein n=1 Tax=Kingdonia uniflora TaxID=39325 RepID=A0A7J7LTW8_9MAGN|nr:hypothetical protein GIB67_033452 [Kingdonia uniflora]